MNDIQLDNLVELGIADCEEYFRSRRLTVHKSKTKRGSIMTKEERDLLLIVATIVLAHHGSSGPDGNAERRALRKALSPFKAEIKTSMGLGAVGSPVLTHEKGPGQ